jgi:NADH-quinone oxidoreductase subunit G
MAPAFATTWIRIGLCAVAASGGGVCPVAGDLERDQIDDVWAALDDRTSIVVVQPAPAIRAAWGSASAITPVRW